MNLNATVDAISDLNTHVHQIQTREDFLSFVRMLVRNLETKPDQWQNQDLPSYLGALAAWVEDMEGYYQNRKEVMPADPTWKTLGQILLASRVYE